MPQFFKCSTMFFNIFFALSGIIIFIVGLFMQWEYSQYWDLIGNKISIFAMILMVLGLSVTLIFCFGCYGTCRENSCIILTYAILVVMILCAEVFAGIFVWTKYSDFKNSMKEEINDTMEQYLQRKDYQDGWKLAQSELSCCGIEGPNDWEKVFHNETLPSSCCTEINLDEASDCTNKHAHSKGCFDALLSVIFSETMMWVLVGAVAIQVILLLCACCQQRLLRKNQQQTV